MKWPWNRRGRGCPSEDAEFAAEQAARAVREGKGVRLQAESIARQLYVIREKNGFGAAVEGTYRRRVS